MKRLGEIQILFAPERGRAFRRTPRCAEWRQWAFGWF